MGSSIFKDDDEKNEDLAPGWFYIIIAGLGTIVIMLLITALALGVIALGKAVL